MTEPGEPLQEPLERWQRRALARLADTGHVPFSELQDEHGHPSAAQIRRFFRLLEQCGAVRHQPEVWWLEDRAVVARVQRWDASRQLTAAYRTGHVADAEEQ